MLTVEGLSVNYGAVRAVDEVSFALERGEVLSILGSNGAGKSSLLKAITGLETARSGSVRFAGEQITNAKAHRIVSLGISHVPEGRRIFPALTIDENLTLGGFLHRRDKQLLAERRRHVYDVFPRLLDRRKQLAGTMSGGEQQMLAIGRALMAGPELLALDEPSLGLAPIVTKQVLQVVRDIADTGVAVLLVEQNARQALRIADRACVLERGRIVLDGSGSALAADERVRHAYLGGFAAME
uniref:ABC transporter ATP-binding protein n=1 Tax=Nocardioides terrisoli TaxID=3388267 RepID=UPI0037C911D8